MSTGPKKSEVSVKIQDWIDNFNRVKGWQAIEVPKPKSVSRRDKDNESFKHSTAGMLQKRMEVLGDPEARNSADEKVKKQQSELQKLEVHVVGVKDEELRKKILEDIERRKDELNKLRADIELYDQSAERLKKVQELEDSLPEDVKGIIEEIKSLRKEVRKKKFNVDSIDKDKLDRFRSFHDMVSNNVENARQEVMTMELKTGKKTVKNHYAVINSDEYKALFGMLEMAILTLQLGEVDDALSLVQDASDRLVEYRNARTGAQAIQQTETFDPKVDEQLRVALLMIDSLRHAERTKAADERQKAYAQLYKELRVAVASKATDIADKFLQRATMLSVAATKDVALSNEITDLAIEAQRDADTMRVNGHKVRPGKVEDKLTSFDAGIDLTDGLKRMQEIREYAAQKLRECKVADQDRGNVDPKQLQVKLTGLEERFDKFFKHDKEGNVRTQKDGKTGLDKGIKKNSDIPRETLQEIELKIKAAQQLLASDSIDALKLAEGQLAALDLYLKNIETAPKVYADFKEALKDIETEIKNIGGKKYGMYEASKRADLQIELDKIRKDYMTKPQSEVAEKINDLKEKVASFHNLVRFLKSKKEALEKRHEEVAEMLSKIGETLKKKFSDSKTKFDGYHGSADGDLSEILSKIKFGTEVSLNEATELLLDLKLNLTTITEALKTYQNDDDDLDEDDYLLTKSFLEDAKRGQASHNENMEQKKNFETAANKLEKKLGELKDEVKEVKGDRSNHDALESELDTLKDETKADKSYVDGLKQVAALTKRAEFQLTEVRNARQIIDSELGDAAKMVVDRVRAFSDAIVDFYDKVVKPVGIAEVEEDGKKKTINQLDTAFDAGKVETFFKSIAAAIPKTALDQLEEAAKKVANKALAHEERLLARNTALSSVRSLTAVFEGFKPIQHFRLNPFDDTVAAPAFGAARQALPRLELRLLTAIKEQQKEKVKG
jgi:DNA repair exonuclease SbcCD ATPase subunit